MHTVKRIPYQLTIVICIKYKSKVLIGNYLFISWRILCVNTSECGVDFIEYAMPNDETIDDSPSDYGFPLALVKYSNFNTGVHICVHSSTSIDSRPCFMRISTDAQSSRWCKCIIDSVIELVWIALIWFHISIFCLFSELLMKLLLIHRIFNVSSIGESLHTRGVRHSIHLQCIVYNVF